MLLLHVERFTVGWRHCLFALLCTSGEQAAKWRSPRGSSNSRSPWVPTPWTVTEHILSTFLGDQKHSCDCRLPAEEGKGVARTPALVPDITLQDVGQVLVNVTKTFQEYWPVEGGPVTSQDCCVSIKKCPLRLIRGKGERTQRALGLGPQCHDVQLGETLGCSGPGSCSGKMMVGETILGSQS